MSGHSPSKTIVAQDSGQKGGPRKNVAHLGQIIHRYFTDHLQIIHRSYLDLPRQIYSRSCTSDLVHFSGWDP